MIQIVVVVALSVSLQAMTVYGAKVFKPSFLGRVVGSEAKTDVVEQSKSGISWDSHKAVDSIPDALVKSIEGNDSMRRKFEMLCRSAQVSHTVKLDTFPSLSIIQICLLRF